MAKELSVHKITVKVANLKSLDSYATKAEKVATRLKKLTQAQLKREKAGRIDTKAYQKAAKSIDYNRERLRKLTGETNKNTSATNRNTVSKKKSAGSSKMAGAAMAAMGLSIAGAVMALRRLATFMISNIKVFAEFERGVKNVTTLMNNDDTGMFKGSLFEGSLQLSRDFGFALNDVNKAMFNAVSAGINGGEAIKFLNQASELAVAGVTNLKSATLGLTTVLNAYGLEASEAERVSQVLFTTQKFGVTTVEELSKSLGVVVPFAAASGISLEELGASIAVTTRSGLDAAKTVTALRAAISQMQKPAAESRDLFIQYGIPIGAAQMKAIGFTETLRRLNKVYKESPRAIEQMFGNVRGLTAIFSLAGDNAQEYNDILEELNNAQLTTANLQKALAENMDSAAMKLAKLNTSWTNLKVAMGQSDWMMQNVEGLTNSFNVLASDGVGVLDKFLLNFNKTLNFIIGGWNFDFGLLDKLIENQETELLEQVMHDTGRKAMLALQMGWDKTYKDTGEKVSLLEITQRGDEGVESLLPTDWSTIDQVIAQSDKIDAIDTKRMEGKQLRDALQLKEALARFRDFSREMTDIEKDEDLQKDNNDRIKAEKEIAWQKKERANRLALSADIKSIQEKGLAENEYAAVTELKIAEAKYANLQDLRNHQVKLGGHSLKEEISLIEQMNKLEMDVAKKKQKLESANSQNYNEEKLRMERELFRKKSDIAKQQADGDISALAAKKKILDLELKHFEDLERIGGESARKASPEEQQMNLQNITNTEIKLAQQKFQEEMKLEKLKQQVKMEGIEVMKQAMTALMDTQLANQERNDEKAKEALQEKFDAGKISQEQLDAETEKIEKQAFDRKKKADKMTLMINYLQELGGIAMNAAANKANAVTFGAAGALQYKILAGLATARMLISKATIDAQQFAEGGIITQSYAKGGMMVKGRSHAQGGEKFAVGGRVVELEGGEAVINKRSASMFRDELSEINVAGGGVPLSPAVKQYSQGGMIPSLSQMQSKTSNNNLDYGLLAKLIGENTNVVLPVESLNEVQNRVKTIEDGSRY